VAGRQRADRPALPRRHACGHELDERVRVANHAERAVAGIRDLRGEVDDALEDDRQ